MEYNKQRVSKALGKAVSRMNAARYSSRLFIISLNVVYCLVTLFALENGSFSLMTVSRNIVATGKIIYHYIQ